MPSDAKYLFVVMMDVEPDKEAEFNENYNKEHIPTILAEVPQMLRATRYEILTEGMPKYLAIYEMTSPDVPESEAFKKAIDMGNWAQKIRPYTKNRSHTVCKRIYPED